MGLRENQGKAAPTREGNFQKTTLNTCLNTKVLVENQAVRETYRKHDNVESWLIRDKAS